MSRIGQAARGCSRTSPAGRGFSMIEVMVALIVIAIAVFGTAKIQALSINATHNSASRSIAALQAASLAAAMRANPSYWESTSAPPPSAVTTYSYSTSTGVGTTTLDTTLNGLTTDCSAGVCTPQQMAAFDLKSWIASVQAALPAGGADVTCATPSSTVPETCTIRLSWLEKSALSNNVINTTLAMGNNILTFSLLVQP